MHTHRRNLDAPAAFLVETLPQLQSVVSAGKVLDMACGKGSNGLFLSERGFDVVLLDQSEEALVHARRRAREKGLVVDFVQGDLEAPDVNPAELLPEGAYAAILVFRYLHRQLFQTIRMAVKPGGVIMYETFTTDQAALGKPTNPDYLLQPGELPTFFPGWDILRHDEGERDEPRAFTARLLARKPVWGSA